MLVAPGLDPLVDVDEPLGDLGPLPVLAVDGDEQILDRVARLERDGDVAAEDLGGTSQPIAAR